MEEDENINHPSHYQTESGLEVLDVIYLFGLQNNFNLANSIKYILRCEKKSNRDQDIRKAIWYLQAELNVSELMQKAYEKSEKLVSKLNIERSAYYE